VLGAPPAFTLSQDQTLHPYGLSFFSSFSDVFFSLPYWLSSIHFSNSIYFSGFSASRSIYYHISLSPVNFFFVTFIPPFPYTFPPFNVFDNFFLYESL
ncbi:hypothetical protein, partial [Oceanotoga teriensis]|uniref:hypothetical protein n=1 Tax=Oceanotoga teriensis TaxID=515440 RepID=UPI00197EF5A0